MSSTRQFEAIEDFCHGHSICAVLTPWQLEKFCRVFALEPAELETNFDGWCKHVLMSTDAVFLFPRHPGFINDVEHELSFYEQFQSLGSVALPKLITRMKDRDISYYEFGVVTRLKGIPFDTLLKDLRLDRMERLLINLAEVIAVWHDIPQDQLPQFLSAPTRPDAKRITLENWHKKVLCPAFTAEAVDYLYRFIRRINAGNPLPGALARETETKARWTAALHELAELQHVLVHGDVHEGHILVEPAGDNITGIIDWQTARIDNPIWDFNFGEWGMGICQWWDDLPDLRRLMWRRYLDIRRLQLSTPEGLNLFFTLWDIIWLLYKRRSGEHPIPTGMNFEDSIRIYLDRLQDITAML